MLDSGVGGLSVCQSILKKNPAVRLVYVADDAHFPYGVMPEDELLQRLLELCEALIPRYQPVMVVLACNTVSTLVLPALRARFSVPFVGVVPAIKPAASLSESRHIGLLATPATVSRPYTDQLIQDFAADCRVLRVGSKELVFEAEKRFRGEEVDVGILRQAIQPFIDEPDLDTVVLGCTHFPFLRDELESILPSVTWVDSGEAIARRVCQLLSEGGQSASNIRPVIHNLLFTGIISTSNEFESYLNSLGVSPSNISLLDVSA